MPFQPLHLIKPGINQDIEIGQRSKKHPPRHSLPAEFSTKNKLSDDAAQSSLGNWIHSRKIVRRYDLSAPDHFIMSILTPTRIMKTPKIFVSC